MKQMTLTIKDGKLARMQEHKERLAMAKPNSIAVKRPDLLEEWDWEKNGELGLSPYQLASSSTMQSWWVCSKGTHSYHVRTSNKTHNNQGCPVCAGKQVVTGYNDLASQAPDIASEWDYERNAKAPDSYTINSHYKAHWICSTHGIKWQAQINLRVKNNSGCPTCGKERIGQANSKPKPGGAYLADDYPEIADQWCYELNGELTPNDVASKSSKLVWWTCPDCGRNYRSIISNRTRLGEGCIDCGRKRVGLKNSKPKQKRSVAELYPDLVSEWHPTKNGDMTPYNTAGRSQKNIWWLCSKCGCEYKSKPYSRSRAKFGCPDCKSTHLSELAKKPADGQSLAEAYPEIAAEWHPEKNNGIKASDICKRTNVNYWWKCSICGNEWKAAPSNRVGEHSGCPECSKKLRVSFPEKALAFYLSQHFTDLEENAKPDFLNGTGFELDIWIPSINTAVEYDGQAWHKNAERDLKKNKVCNDAGIRLIRVRESECATLDDELSIIILRSDCRGTNDLSDAINECMRIILGVAQDVDVERDYQHIASKVFATIETGSIVELYPDVASEWHPTKNGDLVPSMFTPGTITKVWWQCSVCGYEYRTRIAHRCNGHGCRRCASKKNAIKKAKPTPGESLRDKFPDIAEEWHPYKNDDKTPDKVKCGSRVRVWWQCSNCSKEWETTVATRTQAGHKYCRQCYIKLKRASSQLV